MRCFGLMLAIDSSIVNLQISCSIVFENICLTFDRSADYQSCNYTFLCPRRHFYFQSPHAQIFLNLTAPQLQNFSHKRLRSLQPPTTLPWMMPDWTDVKEEGKPTFPSRASTIATGASSGASERQRTVQACDKCRERKTKVRLSCI